MKTGLKNTSHVLTIYIDFKYALEAPEAEQALVSCLETKGLIHCHF